jgi:hypothetical protein
VKQGALWSARAVASPGVLPSVCRRHGCSARWRLRLLWFCTRAVDAARLLAAVTRRYQPDAYTFACAEEGNAAGGTKQCFNATCGNLQTLNFAA